MRAHVLALAAALTSSAILSYPASAAEVCDRNCVGPLCGENCTRTPSRPTSLSVPRDFGKGQVRPSKDRGCPHLPGSSSVRLALGETPNSAGESRARRNS
jgi:hypothetical protein